MYDGWFLIFHPNAADKTIRIEICPTRLTSVGGAVAHKPVCYAVYKQGEKIDKEHIIHIIYLSIFKPYLSIAQ